MKNKIIKVCDDEWIYKNCTIQKNSHVNLIGNYEVWNNDLNETHIGRCNTLKEAKSLCINKLKTH